MSVTQPAVTITIWADNPVEVEAFKLLGVRIGQLAVDIGTEADDIEEPVTAFVHNALVHFAASCLAVAELGERS